MTGLATRSLAKLSTLHCIQMDQAADVGHADLM